MLELPTTPMGFKRARQGANSLEASSSKTPSESPVPKALRLTESPERGRPLEGTRLIILHAKLDPAKVAELVEASENAGATLVNSPEDADVIITEVRMRKRLERHVDWATAVCRSEGLYSLASNYSKRRNRSQLFFQVG